MSRHVGGIFVIWLVLTAVGELLAFAPLYPTVGSESAEEFDFIFRILILLGIPVFTFVIAVLIYGAMRWRADGPEEDGPHMTGAGMAPKIWLAITGSLAIGIMIYPGMVSLGHLQDEGVDGAGWGDKDAELVVDVTAYQFAWDLHYVADDVTVNLQKGKELVLPVDVKVRFNIRSQDVLHSYWIPAFRMKIDALPSRTTFFTVTPDKLGAYQDENGNILDDSYRVQCAELCGVDHSLMRFPVRVVGPAEFTDWINEQKAAAAGRQTTDARN